MGVVERYPAGTLCWIELMTSRLVDDATFYRDLLGWSIEQGVDTAIARLDGRIVAGFVSEPAAGGWRTSVAVDDPVATAHRASELGGTAIGARLIRDPEGAALWLRTAGQDPGAEWVNEVGAWCWSELATADLERAAAFYGELFGWTLDAAEAEIPRAAFSLGERLIAGVHAAQPMETAGAWQVVFRVESSEAAARRAEELGARVLLPPMEIPIGALTVVADPSGVPITLTNFAAPVGGVDGS
jgi:uncharacterized protein